MSRETYGHVLSFILPFIFIMIITTPMTEAKPGLEWVKTVLFIIGLSVLVVSSVLRVREVKR